jgi:hypothetical protein
MVQQRVLIHVVPERGVYPNARSPSTIGAFAGRSKARLDRGSVAARSALLADRAFRAVRGDAVVNASDVSDLAALTSRASDLSTSVDHWNNLSLVALIIAAMAAAITFVAAVAIVYTQKTVIGEAKLLDEVKQRIYAINQQQLAIELEKQKQITANAESERLKLEMQIRPRSLSEGQRSILTAGIRAAGWKNAEIIWHGVGEPEIYARDLARAFDEAGATVVVHTLGPFIPEAWGLSVIETSNGASGRLQALLDSAGVKSSVVQTNDTIGTKDHPTLFVGTREDVGTPIKPSSTAP